ncbi:MAG: SRPBCC family protein [Pseudolysinimonas sp.]
MTDALQGSLIPDGDRGTVRMEDRFDTDITDLWSAITDPARVARWIAVVTGDFRVGGELTGRFTSHWTGTMHVEVCDAPHRLQLLSATGDDQTVMEAVLTEDGNGTRLVIEERGLPVDHLPDHAAGWQVHLEDLDALLAGRPASDWEARWRELIPVYRPVSS